MLNAAPLYCTIKKIQRFEDRVIWRVYGRFSRAITPFFFPGTFLSRLPQVELFPNTGSESRGAMKVLECGTSKLELSLI